MSAQVGVFSQALLDAAHGFERSLKLDIDVTAVIPAEKTDPAVVSHALKGTQQCEVVQFPRSGGSMVATPPHPNCERVDPEVVTCISQGFMASRRPCRSPSWLAYQW